MNLIKNSLTWAFLTRVYVLMNACGINALCVKFHAWIRKMWFDSAAYRILNREGRLAADWDKSIAFKFLTGLINLVPGVLNKLYNAFKEPFDSSCVLSAVRYCGENTHIFISWLFVALLIIPHELWNNMYSLGGLLIILVFYYVAGMKRTDLRLEVKSIGVYAVAFAAFEVLFVFLSVYKSSSVRFFMFHFTCMLLVVLLVSSVRSFKQLIRIIDFSLIGTFIASLYAVYQRIQGVAVNKSYVDLSVSGDMPGRVFSFFQNPNSFAMLLSMVLPAAAALFFYSKGWKRLLYAAVFIVGSMAMLMTGSRGAWAGYALSIMVLALIMRPILVPIFMLIGVFVLPLMPDWIYNRVMTIFESGDSSINSRKPVYEAVRKLIARNPVFGAGLGMDTVKMSVLETNLYTSKTPYVHAHSIYLQIAAELGVFGLLAFLGTILSGIKRGLKTIFGKRGSRQLQAVIAAEISAFAGIMLCSVMDYPWSFPRVMVIFWFVFAVLISAIKLANQEEKE